ncbi:MAG TPA: hypothetical protein H9873_05560 [Candidatus Dorea gallistercoris]|uniref:Uncharacterized protein n=1 Tax=Candidatus Dorea gallistercoris TaxID=2838542 RepID=A0A9D1RC02_9FIRM|nr:hypothetical protein [Candidatus Dorea gallistercoris]
MNLEERIQNYKSEMKIEPKEENILKTIQASRESFLAAEADRMLAYHSFLYLQLRLVRKRWWLLQLLVLAALWAFLPIAEDQLYAYRSMGVAGTLFVILIIPEFWKNQTCQCLEIEAASYYSLRQVYAARSLLFGIADILMITVFCAGASVSLQVSLSALLIQFLFPMVVTACICFVGLCGNRQIPETAAAGLCMVWSLIWWFVLLDERLYAAVTIPVWVLLFGIAALFLAITVYRLICRCNLIWEVDRNGNKDN